MAIETNAIMIINEKRDIFLIRGITDFTFPAPIALLTRLLAAVANELTEINIII